MMPSWEEMARATRQLSPVTMWHAMPRCARAATTPRASGLMGSLMASTAARLAPRATITHVQHWSCRHQASSSGHMQQLLAGGAHANRLLAFLVTCPCFSPSWPFTMILMMLRRFIEQLMASGSTHMQYKGSLNHQPALMN